MLVGESHRAQGTRMTPAEIEELMKLKGWSKTRLAAELDLSENIVYRWINEERTPGGPASILMRQWLDQARADAKKARRNGVHA